MLTDDDCCCCYYNDDDTSYYYEIDGIDDDDDDDNDYDNADDIDVYFVNKKPTKVSFSRSPIKVRQFRTMTLV